MRLEIRANSIVGTDFTSTRKTGVTGAGALRAIKNIDPSKEVELTSYAAITDAKLKLEFASSLRDHNEIPIFNSTAKVGYSGLDYSEESEWCYITIPQQGIFISGNIRGSFKCYVPVTNGDVARKGLYVVYNHETGVITATLLQDPTKTCSGWAGYYYEVTGTVDTNVYNNITVFGDLTIAGSLYIEEA